MAAGSGITPMYQLLMHLFEDALNGAQEEEQNGHLKLSLVFANHVCPFGFLSYFPFGLWFSFRFLVNFISDLVPTWIPLSIISIGTLSVSFLHIPL